MRVAAIAAFERVGYHAFIFKALNIRLYNNYMDALNDNFKNLLRNIHLFNGSEHV